MKKIHYLIMLALLVAVGVGSYFLLRAPSVNVEDFENSAIVITQNPSLPQTELDLRRQEAREREPVREGEDPLEAAADALQDYLRAGLYAEAWRIAQENEENFLNDATYFEIKGDLRSEMGQYRDAVEAYLHSLELGGNTGRIYAKMAELYLFHSSIEEKQDKARALYSYAATQTSDKEEKQELRIRAKSLED